MRQLSIHYQFANLCTKAASFRVAMICENETTVVYMNDVFEVLSKLNVYVHGVRTIPVGFKTMSKMYSRTQFRKPIIYRKFPLLIL